MKRLYYVCIVMCLLSWDSVLSGPVIKKQQGISLKRLHNHCKKELSSDVKKYYAGIDTKNNVRVVDGWFDKRLIPIIHLIDHFQTSNNISGNLAEIGVWQGRSFIPLMHCAKANEYALAIDCFESYECNHDNSGGPCSFEPFMNNITKYCSQPDKLKVIKGDSFKFTHYDYLNGFGNEKKIRIFSIDGCHEADTTAKDIENAYNALGDGGVIIIDDYFHFCWPGVSEGVNIFMNKNVNTIKPFLIMLNKVFFSQPDYAKQYYDTMKNFFTPEEVSIKKFFNVETVIYDPKN